MKMKSVCGSLAVLVVLTQAVSSSGKQPESFDLLKLSLRTKGESCVSTQQRCELPKEQYPIWTIQGLRPAWSNGNPGPENCKGPGLLITDIEPVRSSLECAWYSCDTTSYDNLWLQEYTKHGSCIVNQLEDIQTPAQLFQITIMLYATYNVPTWLDSAGIVPSNKEKVALSDLQAAVASGSPGVQVEFDCQGQLDGHDILHEIRVCLSPDDYKPAACGPTSSNACKGASVWYREKKN